MTHRRPFPSLPFSFSSFSSLSLGPAVSVGAENGEEGEEEEDEEEGMWGRMLPEIMTEIISRVEASEERWPSRKDVVACGGVCRRWRDVTLGIVNATCEGGSKITFPSSLRQPGPRDPPFQCFIKRNKKTATFYLYLSLNQRPEKRLRKVFPLCARAAHMDTGKFLLAARRSRHGAYIEYIMSLDPEDLSQGSNAYMGKLRSDFLGTNYTIYDSQPPFNGAKASNNRASRRFACKQISPQVPAGNFVIGQVSYKFNILKLKGPRRMKCVLQCPSFPSTKNSDEDTSVKTSPKSSSVKTGPVVLKNKAPRWHEHLQCWCLNFHGRVTVASVKNFQLVATADPSQPWGLGDEDTVILQFGKVADDVFTMDYRQPLSAFQAFVICLTSFGTKIACE